MKTLQAMMEKAREIAPRDTLAGGGRVAYGVHGEGDPVVLLHGTPSSSYIWRNVLPALVAGDHAVYVYDLLGYGLSERPWDERVDTSVTGQTATLLELLNFWKLERAHVVAHDIGGAVAQRLGVFYPQRVKTLTLIDCVSFDSWPSKRTREQMQEGLEVLIKKEDAEHRRHFAEWLYTTVENKGQLQKNALELYVGYISGAVGQGSLFQHQVAHYDPRHTAEISERLAQLGDLPTQLIWGENDAWQTTDWAKKLNAAIPNSVLHVLPNCGHFAMEDQPQKICELLLQFMQKA